MPTYVNKNCPFCNCNFNIQLKDHNAGRKKYCSKECAHNALKKSHAPNLICCICDKKFYRTPSKQKSKSGYYFCSYLCKNKAQSIGEGFEDMLPPHYGASTSGNSVTYRRIAFAHYPIECLDCGWNEVQEVLHVHHIDNNRKNNDPDNLMILCPTHHFLRHWHSKTGSYSQNKMKRK